MESYELANVKEIGGGDITLDVLEQLAKDEPIVQLPEDVGEQEASQDACDEGAAQ